MISKRQLEANRTKKAYLYNEAETQDDLDLAPGRKLTEKHLDFLLQSFDALLL